MFFREGAVVSHPFLGEGGGTQGEGEVPICNRHQGEGKPRKGEPRGGGVPVCNRHQGEVGPKKGGGPSGGTIMSHPLQGGVAQGGGGSTNHSQGEGGGQIMLMWPETSHPYTINWSIVCKKSMSPWLSIIKNTQDMS